MKDLSQAILLNSTFSDAYLLRALAYLDSGDYHNSFKDADKAISLAPDQGNAYFVRGLALERLGEKENIETLSRKGLVHLYLVEIPLRYEILEFEQHNPGDKYTYYRQGLAYYKLKKHIDAIKKLSQSIQIDPKFANAYLLRALAYLDAGDYQNSLKDSNNAISLERDYDVGNAYLVRGLALWKLGEQENANKNYRIGQEKNAERDYRYARGIWPCISCSGGSGVQSNNADVYFDRGIALARRGDKQGAVNSLKKAADIFQTQGNQTRYQETLRRVVELQK